MIAELLNWFRSRTAREQVLLQLAAFVCIGIGGAFLFYQAASGFRSSATAELAGASALRSDVSRLSALLAKTPTAAPPPSDGTVRGIVSATAAHWGLGVAGLEPAGPTAIRVRFEPAAASAVLQWVDTAEHAGLLVTRVSLVRAGEGDLVRADATVGTRQS